VGFAGAFSPRSPALHRCEWSGLTPECDHGPKTLCDTRSSTSNLKPSDGHAAQGIPCAGIKAEADLLWRDLIEPGHTDAGANGL